VFDLHIIVYLYIARAAELCEGGRMTVAWGRVEMESGGTRRRTGGEVKGKEANGVVNQQSSA